MRLSSDHGLGGLRREVGSADENGEREGRVNRPEIERLVARLAALPLLAEVPRAQLAWLAERGELRRFPAQARLAERGDPIDHLWIVLSGHYDLRVPRGGGLRRIVEWRTGDIGGRLPFSRMAGNPGVETTEVETEVFLLHRDHFPALVRDCYELTAVLVHVMLDRARHFRSSDLHDEKLASLGRLAAGLAHELNNPASAAARGAEMLGERLLDVELAAHAVGALAFDDSERAALAELRGRAVLARDLHERSPLDQAERLEQLGLWLERLGADPGAAEILAETEVAIADLERASSALGPERLRTVLASIGASLGAAKLASEIERAAARVHELVAAVKGFTYLDQAQTPKPVDLGRGLADTLAVMRAKAKQKSVRLTAAVAPGLPPVVGFGGELNQIWANLIDNAIDAVAEGGSVEIRALAEGDRVVVTVRDDGAGIPPELQGRMFEPFFTTKPVGEGTGLGLAIVRNLLNHHRGEIAVASRPGETEFRVTLPAAPAGS